MLKKVLFTAILMVIILALAILMTYNARIILFHSLPWLIAGATGLGIIIGILRGIRQNAYEHRLNYSPDRHTIDSFLEHWGSAVGIIILIISGFFITASYRRGFSTNLHFLGLVITLFFGTYFFAHFLISKKYKYLMPTITDVVDGTIKKYLLKNSWKETGKYLSSQKSAFLIFSLLGIGVLLTGAFKLAVYYFSVPGQITHIATQTHDLFGRLFVLMLLIHILFVAAVSSHRHLLPSLFTGKLKQKV